MTDENQPRRSGMQRALPLVGLSFWQAWWMLLSTTGLMCGPIQRGMGTINVILLVTLLGYVVLTVCARRFAPYSRPSAFAIAGAGCFAGSLLVSLSTHIPLPPVPGAALEIGGAAIMAFCNALLLIMWGERWSTLAGGDVGRQLCASFAFAFVLYFAALFLPTGIGIAFNALLAPLSAWALSVSQALPARTEPIAPVPLKARPTAAVLSCIAILSFAFGCMQRCAYARSEDAGLQAFSMVVAGALVALFALIMAARHKVGDPFSFYRPIVACVTCGMLVFLMAAPGRAYLGNGILIAGIYCLDMFIMFAASDFAYRARRPVALVFGSAVIAARAGTALGTQFGAWATATLPLGDATVDAVVLALSCAVVVAGTVVFTETDLRSLYQPDTKPRVPDLDGRCDQLAASAGLSARELDVMRLLARGRSVAAISEALGIAQGTVKHHASNTYRKLGLYDRQGLIDLVAGNAAEPEQPGHDAGEKPR